METGVNAYTLAGTRYESAASLDAAFTELGYPVSVDGLTKLADEIASGSPGAAAADVMSSVFRGNLLAVVAESKGDAHLVEIDRRWREEFAAFQKCTEAAREAGAPDVFGRNAMVARGILLKAVMKPAVTEDLRTRAKAAASGAARTRPWFAAMGDPDSAGAGALLAMDVSSDAAEEEAKFLQGSRASRTRKRVSRLIGVGLTLGVIALLALALTGGGNPDQNGLSASGAPSPGATSTTVLSTGVTNTEVQLQEAPDQGAAVLASLPQFTVVRVMDDRTADWYQVRIGDAPDAQLGWVPRSTIDFRCQGMCNVG